jgi:hypothetical protein
MHRLIGLALLLAAAPVAAKKVTIDYAHDYDFMNVKTFEYVPSDDPVKDPLVAARIDSFIKEKLDEAGLEEVTENPDIYVTYHYITKENQVLNTTGFGYGGYGPGWGAWGGGISTATTTVSTYTVGTLVIDAYRASDKKLVWRGTGTETNVSSDPQKRTKQAEKIIDKLADRWDRILKNQGK